MYYSRLLFYTKNDRLRDENGFYNGKSYSTGRRTDNILMTNAVDMNIQYYYTIVDIYNTNNEVYISLDTQFYIRLKLPFIKKKKPSFFVPIVRLVFCKSILLCFFIRLNCLYYKYML